MYGVQLIVADVERIANGSQHIRRIITRAAVVVMSVNGAAAARNDGHRCGRCRRCDHLNGGIGIGCGAIVISSGVAGIVVLIRTAAPLRSCVVGAAHGCCIVCLIVLLLLRFLEMFGGVFVCWLNGC